MTTVYIVQEHQNNFFQVFYGNTKSSHTRSAASSYFDTSKSTASSYVSSWLQWPMTYVPPAFFFSVSTFPLYLFLLWLSVVPIMADSSSNKLSSENPHEITPYTLCQVRELCSYVQAGGPQQLLQLLSLRCRFHLLFKGNPLRQLLPPGPISFCLPAVASAR